MDGGESEQTRRRQLLSAIRRSFQLITFFPLAETCKFLLLLVSSLTNLPQTVGD